MYVPTPSPYAVAGLGEAVDPNEARIRAAVQKFWTDQAMRGACISAGLRPASAFAAKDAVRGSAESCDWKLEPLAKEAGLDIEAFRARVVCAAPTKALKDFSRYRYADNPNPSDRPPWVPPCPTSSTPAVDLCKQVTAEDRQFLTAFSKWPGAAACLDPSRLTECKKIAQSFYTDVMGKSMPTDVRAFAQHYGAVQACDPAFAPAPPDSGGGGGGGDGGGGIPLVGKVAIAGVGAVALVFILKRFLKKGGK